ncbi:MAG: hypothetical protein P4L90_16270 [Rhodopila sp.]|nr:hypothetical protein [Rhodopila sp.]
MIGALGGIVTTWLTMFAQERARRNEHAVSHRESLYGDFVDEASRIFSDALSHKLEDASKLVKLYAILSKLRLFAPADVLLAADHVVERLIQTYEMPETDFRSLIKAETARNLDVLRTFSDVCRKGLVV